MSRILKNSVFASVLLLIHATIYSQSFPVYDMGLFTEGSTAYLFADNVNLREAPTTSAKSIGKLPAGSELKIFSYGSSLVVNGLQAPWYEIESGGKRGWIWGGFIALTTLNSGSDLIIYGLTGHSPDSNFMGEIRYLKGSRILASLSLKPFNTQMTNSAEYHYSVNSTLLPSTGLKGVNSIIEIEFEYPACGYTNGKKYIAWTGKDFLYVADAPSVNEAAVFHFESTLIFPWNEGGKDNQVINRGVTSEWSEKKEDYEVTEVTEDIIKWDGIKFAPQSH